jgi:hypothetical protein
MINQVRVWSGLVAISSMVGLAMPTLARAEVVTSGSAGVAEAAVPLQRIAQSFPVIEFPPDSTVIRDGTFPGRGIASGSKFSIGRQADAVLSFSNANNNFSISIAATVAEDLELMYQGTITRKTTGTRGINSFILETQVDSFVSSLNNYQIFDATGTCRIEVFNDLVVSSSCNADAPAFPTDLLEPGLSSDFRGIEQF